MLHFTPSLLDRLLDDAPAAPAEPHTPRVSLESLKDSVARDLEALLNARCGLQRDALEGYAHAQRSILSFGMLDFSSMSLANTEQRDQICRSLEDAIATHEPRLKSVLVGLAEDSGPQRLMFTIQALLVVNPTREPVNFSAMLQPSTQLYSVSRPRRGSLM